MANSTRSCNPWIINHDVNHIDKYEINKKQVNAIVNLSSRLKTFILKIIT